MVLSRYSNMTELLGVDISLLCYHTLMSHVHTNHNVEKFQIVIFTSQGGQSGYQYINQVKRLKKSFLKLKALKLDLVGF